MGLEQALDPHQFILEMLARDAKEIVAFGSSVSVLQLANEPEPATACPYSMHRAMGWLVSLA